MTSPLRLGREASPAGIAAAGLAALAVAMGIGRFAFTPILPMMLEDAGLAVSQGGWLASANYVGYLAGALSAVALRGDPGRLVRGSLVAVGLATLAMGLSMSLAAWVVWRFIAGAASAWVLVVASSWCLEELARRAPEAQRATLSAALFSGVGVGIAVAGTTCVLLAIAHLSSRDAWLALGALALGTTAFLWPRFATGTQDPAHAKTTGGFDRAWLAPIACYGAFGFGYIIPATFLSAMARETFPDPAVYGWCWPVFGAAAAASTFAAARMRGRLSDRAVWIAGHLVMALGVAMPLFVAGLAGIVTSAFLVGGTFMVVTMAGMQEARRIAGARARSLMAAMTSSFALGQIAGPLLVSYLSVRGHGFAPALALAGLVLVASAAILRVTSSPRTP